MIGPKHAPNANGVNNNILVNFYLSYWYFWYKVNGNTVTPNNNIMYDWNFPILKRILIYGLNFHRFTAFLPYLLAAYLTISYSFFPNAVDFNLVNSS